MLAAPFILTAVLAPAVEADQTPTRNPPPAKRKEPPKGKVVKDPNGNCWLLAQQDCPPDKHCNPPPPTKVECPPDDKK
jgi:hypothetical protein